MASTRSLPALAVVAGIAGLIMSGCSGVTPVAMSVNGDDVSVDVVRSDLRGLAASKSFVAQNGAVEVAKGAYDTNITAAVLRQRMYGKVFSQELERRKVKPQAVTAEMQSQIEGSVGGKENFDQMTPAFKKQLTDSVAVQFTLLETIKKDLGTAEKFYATHKNEFVDTCIAHVLTNDLKTAESARARIVGGESMTAVAAALSIDTSNKDKGGDLGCGSPTQYVPEFSAAAVRLPLNELSEPVKTQFGYHVLIVTKRTEKPFAEVKSAVESRLSTLPNERLDDLVRQAKVSVNPKFGVYVKDNGQNFPSILPTGSSTASAG